MNDSATNASGRRRATLKLLNGQADERASSNCATAPDLAQVQRRFQRDARGAAPGGQRKAAARRMQAETVAETAVSNLDELERTGQHDVLTLTPNRR
jgi:hypothetical protein